MKHWIKTLVIAAVFVLLYAILCVMVTSVEAQTEHWPPKDYHSYVTVFTDSGGLLAQVYCQTEEEAQVILRKVADCITGKIDTVVWIGDSVLKPSVIGYAVTHRKYSPHIRKGDR